MVRLNEMRDIYRSLVKAEGRNSIKLFDIVLDQLVVTILKHLTKKMKA